MKFKYKIKGLGSIKEAEIDIAPFTLIAGKNNSGKSFTTKSLYCILEALNDDYVLNILFKLYNEIRINFFNFLDNLKNPAKMDTEFIEYFRTNFLEMLQKIMLETRSHNEDVLPIFVDDLKNSIDIIEEYISKRKSLKKFKNLVAVLQEIKNIAKEILKITENPTKIIIRSIDKNLNINFKKNFEITSFSSILNMDSKKRRLLLDIENIGKIEIDSNLEQLEFSFFRDGVKKIQQLSNVIYIDSPVYTKLMKLLSRKTLFDLLDDDKFLKDYPLYIDKLYTFLEKKYIDKPEFFDLSKKIQKIINGKLEIDNNKNINFIYQNKNIPISLTAMGVTNIGIIDMLIRNNSINKGSFLIIDEPEVHLHPEWQVEFVNILYDIAKAGANVIITSHSIDIVKAVELLSKNDSENIAINKMPYTKEFQNKTVEEKIGEILDDLNSPYYRMYMEGL